MNTKTLVMLACLAAGLVCGSVSAQAFDGIGGYYAFPWFGYGNNGPAAYSLGNIPAPPYFALHPPVYYSHPVPRPYGHSPFACPGHCHTERAVAVRVLANPHVKMPAAPVERPANVAATPKRIANPYYEPAGQAATLASGRE
jgi:hypothetical protein